MFPIRPVPDNNVIKPEMYVFKDEEDYRKRGKNVDEEYYKSRNKNKKLLRNRIGKDQLSLKRLRHQRI